MRCAPFAQTTDVQSDITKRTLGFCGALSKVGVTFQHADQQGSWDRYWASFLDHQQASSVFFCRCSALPYVPVLLPLGEGGI